MTGGCAPVGASVALAWSVVGSGVAGWSGPGSAVVSAGVSSVLAAAVSLGAASSGEGPK